MWPIPAHSVQSDRANLDTLISLARAPADGRVDRVLPRKYQVDPDVVDVRGRTGHGRGATRQPVDFQAEFQESHEVRIGLDGEDTPARTDGVGHEKCVVTMVSPHVQAPEAGAKCTGEGSGDPGLPVTVQA